METPADAETLQRICSLLAVSPRDLLRKREPESAALRSAPDAEVLAAMAAAPRLMERPIVVNGDRAAIGRPPENVLRIL